MMIKTIVCDMDGTLFSSENMVGEAYARAVRAFNREFSRRMRIPTTEVIMREIGRPVEEILKIIFPQLKDSERAFIRTLSRKYLVDLIKEDKGLVYPSVKETIAILKQMGYNLKLASNGGTAYINAILDHYHLSPIFGPFITLNNENLKDKGDVLNLHKSILGLMADEMVMVGDRLQDAQAAEKAGCRFIGVTYGHGTIRELKSAVKIIRSFHELPNAIVTLEKETIVKV